MALRVASMLGTGIVGSMAWERDLDEEDQHDRLLATQQALINAKQDLARKKKQLSAVVDELEGEKHRYESLAEKMGKKDKDAQQLTRVCADHSSEIKTLRREMAVCRNESLAHFCALETQRNIATELRAELDAAREAQALSGSQALEHAEENCRLSRKIDKETFPKSEVLALQAARADACEEVRQQRHVLDRLSDESVILANEASHMKEVLQRLLEKSQEVATENVELQRALANERQQAENNYVHWTTRNEILTEHLERAQQEVIEQRRFFDESLCSTREELVDSAAHEVQRISLERDGDIAELRERCVELEHEVATRDPRLVYETAKLQDLIQELINV